MFQKADGTGTKPSFGTMDLHIVGRALPASDENLTPRRAVTVRLNSAIASWVISWTTRGLLPVRLNARSITSAHGEPILGVPSITRCSTWGRPSSGFGGI